MGIVMLDIVDEDGSALVKGRDFKFNEYTDECGNHHMRVMVKNLGFNKHEKQMLLGVIEDAIRLGDDLYVIKELIKIYDKIISEENSVNE